MALHPAWLDSLAGLDRDPELAPLMFQRPAFRFAVDIAGMTPRLIEAPPTDSRLPAPMMPKLGAKSWRDGGSLQILDDVRPFAAQVPALFATLSDVQQRYLALIRPVATLIDLTLFPYRDFTQISELRCRVTQGCATISSRALRGASAAHARDAGDAACALARRVAEALASDAIVDLAIEPSDRLSVLEVNPSRGSVAP